MNKFTGKLASAFTLLAVAGFALSMLIDSNFGSYLSSMFIAWGFVPMICAFAAYTDRKKTALGYTAIAFAAVYAVLIMLVYYAQLTAVRAGNLSEQARDMLDYSRFGLFFSYDLLGYAFMALSTFFVSFAVERRGKADGVLIVLLRLHGIFAVTCVVMPLLGLFTPNMAGGDLIGVLVLEVWCAYFIPLCILAYRHFHKLPK